MPFRCAILIPRGGLVPHDRDLMTPVMAPPAPEQASAAPPVQTGSATNQVSVRADFALSPR